MNHRADAFRMRLDEHGHVLLEFGHRAADDALDPPANPAGTFTASDRIVMAPDIARRLIDGLADALGRGAAPAVSTEPRASAPDRSVRPAVLRTVPDDALRQRGTTPLNAPPDPAAENAAWLMNAVREMAPAHYQERSFRIAPQSLQANRFLLSISSSQLPPDASARAWAICRHLGIPAGLRPQFEQEFARGDHVHFGFEGEPGKVMCKVYFERTVTGLDAARSRETGEPALQYVAFKWNCDRDEHVVSRYHWHAGLSLAAIEGRLAKICEPASPALLEMARSVVRAAAARLPPERLLYLEVTEDGQPRQSFDVNFYDARLQMRDLQPMLFAMRDHFGIRPGQFQALYDQLKTKPMGHLAGGVHRDGQEFFNVYFGGTRQA